MKAKSSLSRLLDSRAWLGFGTATLYTLSGAGDFHANLTVPSYPRDAQRQDLARIGQDMYRALGKYAEETQGAAQG